MTIHGGELHKFIFEGLPVRGVLVRLTGAWTEMLARRQAAGGYPAPVRQLLGEMSAAATLMQANIKFNGALVLQIQGDGPVKLAVAEAQPDLTVRATAKVVGDLPAEASLKSMLDVVRKFGVEVIGDTNVPLDPNVHQAIAMVESEDVAPGNVLGVMQKGYTLNGRTIRAAMVTVAKAK